MDHEPVARLAEKEPVVLDVAGLLARMGGKRDVARRMANIYLQMHPDQITVLRRLAAEGDLNALRLQAHTIKGGAGNIGGHALHSVVTQMETWAHEGKREDALRLLPSVERESVRLLEALKAEFSES